MPFENLRKTEEPEKSFDEIDKIILGSVLPNVETWIGLYTLLPNSYFGERGPTRKHDPRKYFVLSCLEAGLSYVEVGLWLDTCLEKYVVQNSDGKTRYINSEQERSTRFDHRKPVYYFDGIARRYLRISEAI